MATTMKASAIFLIFPFVLSLCSAEGSVPIIAWSNTDSMSSLSGVPAGHTVTISGLQSHYLNHFVDRPQNIVVLLQDKLSMEDFTLYGDVYSEDQSQNAFKNLKNSLDTSASHLTLPAVDVGEDVDNLVEYLTSHINGEVVDMQTPDELKDQQLDKSKTNLIILHLTNDEVDDGKSKREKLSENDKILGQVTQFFKSQQGAFTIILTASEPHKVLSKDILNRVRRADEESQSSSSSTGNSTYLFLNTSCVLLFAQEIRLVINDTSKDYHSHVDLAADDVTVNADADCSEVNRTLTATFKKNTESEKLDLTLGMAFNNDRGMWTTDLFQIQYKYEYTNSSKKYSIDTTDEQKHRYMTAPMKKSYHCDNPPDGSLNNATGTIEFVKLQLQPYNITTDGFSDADDCVGFFTAELWMVLLTVLLLLMILSFGLVFLLNLSTMDRFDDPKGKQLMITTDE